MRGKEKNHFAHASDPRYASYASCTRKQVTYPLGIRQWLLLVRLLPGTSPINAQRLFPGHEIVAVVMSNMSVTYGRDEHGVVGQ